MRPDQGMKKLFGHILLTAFILLNAGSIYPQSKLDSLKYSYKHSKSDEEKIITTIEIGKEYIYSDMSIGLIS